MPSRLPRAALILATAGLAGCNLAPRDLRPALPVPPSWPTGDAYLRQSEAALPSVSYAEVFPRSSIAGDHHAGAGQQPRPADRRRQHRRGARAVPRPAWRAVSPTRRQRTLHLLRRRQRHAQRRRHRRVGLWQRVGHRYRNRNGNGHRNRHGHRNGYGHQRQHHQPLLLAQQLFARPRRHRLRARPVRPRPLADPRRAGPVFRAGSGGARHPADAGRRHRVRLADLCRRPQPDGRSTSRRSPARSSRSASPTPGCRAASRHAPT